MFQPYSGKEDQFQISVTNYMRNAFPGVTHIHVANERKASVIQGRKLKLKGVVSGVPDNLIFDWSLAVELKTGRNKLTENQINFMKGLQACGWSCFVVYSIDEFILIVTEYSKGNRLESDKDFRFLNE